jgi:hypothetical protein
LSFHKLQECLICTLKQMWVNLELALKWLWQIMWKNIKDTHQMFLFLHWLMQFLQDN